MKETSARLKHLAKRVGAFVSAIAMSLSVVTANSAALTASAATNNVEISYKWDTGSTRTNPYTTKKITAGEQGGVAGQYIKANEQLVRFKPSSISEYAFCIEPSVGMAYDHKSGSTLVQKGFTEYDSDSLADEIAAATKAYWKNFRGDEWTLFMGKVQYYGYMTHQTGDYYAATQILLWEMILGRRGHTRKTFGNCPDALWNDFTYPTGSGTWCTKAGVEKAYNDIVAQVKAHYDAPKGLYDKLNDAEHNPYDFTYNNSNKRYEAKITVPTASVTASSVAHNFSGFKANLEALIKSKYAGTYGTDYGISTSTSGKNTIYTVWTKKVQDATNFSNKNTPVALVTKSGMVEQQTLFTSATYQTCLLSAGIDPAYAYYALGEFDSGNAEISKKFTDSTGETVTVPSDERNKVGFNITFKSGDTKYYVTASGSAGNYEFKSVSTESGTTFKLSSSNKFLLTGLPFNTYTITEVSTADNYKKAADVNFTLSSNGTKKATVTNSHINAKPVTAAMYKDWDLTTTVFGENGNLTNNNHQILNSQVYFTVVIQNTETGNRYYLTNPIRKSSSETDSDGNLLTVFDANCLVKVGNDYTAELNNNVSTRIADVQKYLQIDYYRDGIKIINLPKGYTFEFQEHTVKAADTGKLTGLYSDSLSLTPANRVATATGALAFTTENSKVTVKANADGTITNTEDSGDFTINKVFTDSEGKKVTVADNIKNAVGFRIYYTNSDGSIAGYVTATSSNAGKYKYSGVVSSAKVTDPTVGTLFVLPQNATKFSCQNMPSGTYTIQEVNYPWSRAKDQSFKLNGDTKSITVTNKSTNSDTTSAYIFKEWIDASGVEYDSVTAAYNFTRQRLNSQIYFAVIIETSDGKRYYLADPIKESMETDGDGNTFTVFDANCLVMIGSDYTDKLKYGTVDGVNYGTNYLCTKFTDIKKYLQIDYRRDGIKIVNLPTDAEVTFVEKKVTADDLSKLTGVYNASAVTSDADKIAENNEVARYAANESKVTAIDSFATIINSETSGNAEISKVFLDSTGKKIAVADTSKVTFQLKLNSTNEYVIAKKISDGVYEFKELTDNTEDSKKPTNFKISDNKFIVNYLPVGSYTLIETASANNEFELAADKTFTVSNGKTKGITVSNSHTSPDTIEATLYKNWDVTTSLFTDDEGNFKNSEHTKLNSQVYFRVVIENITTGRRYYLTDPVKTTTGTDSEGNLISVYDANCLEKLGNDYTNNFNGNVSTSISDVNSFVQIDYYREGLRIINVPDGYKVEFQERSVTNSVLEKLPGKYNSTYVPIVDGSANDSRIANVDGALRFISDNATVVVTSDKEGVITNTEKYLTLGIKKKSTAGNYLSGGEFGLYDSNKNLLETITSTPNSYGNTYFNGSYPVGQIYYVREHTAPEGYVKDDTYYQVELSASSAYPDAETTQVVELPLRTYFLGVIENEPVRGRIEINKIDSKYNIPLKDIQFEIRDSNETVVDTITTDENGYAISKLLDLGDYTVLEITKTYPYAYVNVSAELVTISLDDYDETQQLGYALKSITVTNQPEEGIIRVYKRGYNGTLLEGAAFELRYSEQFTDIGGTVHPADELVTTLVTDENGYASTLKELDPGVGERVEYTPLYLGAKYYLVETQAPDNYVLDETKHTFEFDWDGNEFAYKEINITNAPQDGDIVIYKHTEGDLNIEGITFTLAGISILGIPVNQTAETDADGKATFADIPVGTYEITENEDSVPYAYLVANKQSVTVIYNDTVQSEFFNVEKTGEIEVQKRTEGDLNIEGIGFTLSGTSDSGREISANAVTDADGKAVFNFIPIGTYTVTENGDSVPYAYLVAEPQEVTVAYAKTSNVEFFNDEKTGEIEVTKRTEGDVNVKGIKFTLNGTSDSGRKISIEAETDANGKAVFNGIPVGTYTVTENGDSVPTAYLVADEQKVAVAYAKTSNVEFFNDEKTGEIEINKQTTGNKNIKGITFTLSGTSDSGREISISAVTDANGKAVFNGIPVGTYSVTENEKSVPYAYLVAEPLEVSVAPAQTTTIKVFNNEKTGVVEVTKATANGRSIEGINFVLKGISDSGREISINAVTDANGKAIFNNVPIGTYIISESAETVPFGYLVADDKEVEVKYATSTNIEVFNDTTKVKFSKKSITGEGELEGAKLKVLDKDGNIVDEWISGKEPHYIEGVLKAGEKYRLHEEIAPDGYIVANDIEFEVKDNGEVQHVEMFDDTTKIKVSKKAVTGDDELEGALLQIIDENGNIVDEWISGKNVHYIEGVLKAGGTYRLHEVAAPDGYIVENDITFKVYDNGEVQFVEMYDDTTKVKISKKTMTGEDELEGAKLQLTDKDGNIVDEWISGKEPHYIEGKLKAGETYKLHEVIAPNGYEVASDIEFTVNSDGTINEIVMKDAEKKRNPHTGSDTVLPIVLCAMLITSPAIFMVIRKRKED